MLNPTRGRWISNPGWSYGIRNSNIRGRSLWCFFEYIRVSIAKPKALPSPHEHLSRGYGQTKQQRKKMPEQEVSKLHYVNINARGTFTRWPIERLSEYHTTPEDVDRIFENLRAEKPEHIVLFVHGGLVGEKKGMEAVSRFHRFYNEKSKVYPIGFIWETDPLTAFIGGVEDNFKNSEMKGLFGIVRRLVLKKLGMEDRFNSSVLDQADLEAFTRDYRAEENTLDVEWLMHKAWRYKRYSLKKLEAEMNQELTLGHIGGENLKADRNGFVAESFGSMAKSITIAARCIYRFARRRHHGFFTTILEEIYRALRIAKVFGPEEVADHLWSQMKRQAKDMWKKNVGIQGEDQHAGRYFLDRLQVYMQEMKEQNMPVAFEAVAHSAGSIVICEMLRCIQANRSLEHVRLNNVIFLAPAVTCSEFEDTVMAYPDLYARFRMFTMQKEKELEDRLLNARPLRGIYPSSLLYLVSGLCEDGRLLGRLNFKGDVCILGLHQHISNEGPYADIPILQRIHAFLNDETVEQRLVLTPTPEGTPPGFCGQAIDHGDFDNDGDEHHQTLNRYEGSIRQSIDVMFGG